MIIKTKDLIKFLPIDKDTKKDILSKYDTFNDAQKYSTQKLCWLMFTELVSVTARYELEKDFAESVKGKYRLDNGTYARKEEEVYSRFLRAIHEGQEEESIASVRENLRQQLTDKTKASLDQTKKQ